MATAKRTPTGTVNSRLVALIKEMSSGQGFSTSRLPGVKFMRAVEYFAPTPIAYEPSIVIIAQGRKAGRLGDRTFIYDANNYLVLALPLPFECETFGSTANPLLGLSINVTPALVAELLVQIENQPSEPHTRPQAIESTALDTTLQSAALRLLESLRSPDDARILGPQIVREITYRVLLGPLGTNLRALATPQSHFGQISRVLNRIHAEFAKPVEIETLARDAGMSVSTFHTHFKAVTASSPLQYLKTIRLHKARTLMVHDGLNAATAALQVGYESASQFSREFKRYFGNAPAADASQFRSSLMRFA